MLIYCSTIGSIYFFVPHYPTVGCGVKVERLPDMIEYIGSNTFGKNQIASLDAVCNGCISAAIYTYSDLPYPRCFPVVCFIFKSSSVIKQACPGAYFVKIFGYIARCCGSNPLCTCGRPQFCNVTTNLITVNIIFVGCKESVRCACTSKISGPICSVHVS